MSRDTVYGPSQNVGNTLGHRSSTRIHAPPGGASSISLGAEPAPHYAAPARARPAVEPVAAAVAPVPMHPADYRDNIDPIAYRRAAADPKPAPVAAAPGRASAVSSNVWASGASQNSGNFITDRPTTRIHAPPGGASSIRLF